MRSEMKEKQTSKRVVEGPQVPEPKRQKTLPLSDSSPVAKALLRGSVSSPMPPPAIPKKKQVLLPGCVIPGLEGSKNSFYAGKLKKNACIVLLVVWVFLFDFFYKEL